MVGFIGASLYIHYKQKKEIILILVIFKTLHFQQETRLSCQFKGVTTHLYDGKKADQIYCYMLCYVIYQCTYIVNNF